VSVTDPPLPPYFLGYAASDPAELGDALVQLLYVRVPRLVGQLAALLAGAAFTRREVADGPDKMPLSRW